MHHGRAPPAPHGQTCFQIQRSLHFLGNRFSIQQNYNQLYHAYSEKITEIERLHQENDLLRR